MTVTVTMVSPSELPGLELAMTELDEAVEEAWGGLLLAKHPTSTPTVVFIGTARHEKPAAQGTISKTPLLEQVARLPLIQAT